MTFTKVGEDFEIVSVRYVMGFGVVKIARGVYWYVSWMDAGTLPFYSGMKNNSEIMS